DGIGNSLDRTGRAVTRGKGMEGFKTNSSSVSFFLPEHSQKARLSLSCRMYGRRLAACVEGAMNDGAMHFDSWDTALAADARALADRLFPLFYDDLRSLARRERHRVGAGVTMQTTALVNEAYLKLRRGHGWNTDAHFLRAAALAMRHALVNHSAARQAA